MPDPLQWSAWFVLEHGWRGPLVPLEPGLYRVRRIGREEVDYIGQTGVGLRQRLRMLRGVYGPEMPYNDPHTAAPALWAQHQLTGERYEASVVPLPGTATWRKGMECVAIALYRQASGRSPTFNFGRMPPGFSKSSGNNARLMRLGMRFRGGAVTEPLRCHAPGVSPVGLLMGAVTSPEWCGHAWSPWWPAAEVGANVEASACGLYRLRRAEAGRLTYLGQGLIRSR